MGKVGVKLALTYKRRTIFKVLTQKKFIKLIIIFIVIVNVLFTLFLVKYLAYNMLGQQLTDFVEGETIINVHKGLRQKAVLPNKITSINIF